MTAGRERQLCPGCGHPNALECHFCEECHAPLTSSATTEPMGQIHSEGYAYEKASERADKPIGLIGTWLMWAPLVCIAGLVVVGLAVVFMSELFTSGIQPGNSSWLETGFSAAILLGFLGGIIWIGCVLLTRASRKFANRNTIDDE